MGKIIEWDNGIRCRKYSVSLDQKNEGEGSVIHPNIADETLIQELRGGTRGLRGEVQKVK